MSKSVRSRFIVLAVLMLAAFSIHCVRKVQLEPPTPTSHQAGAGPDFWSRWRSPERALEQQGDSPPAALGQSNPGSSSEITVRAELDRTAVLRDGDGTVHLEVTIAAPISDVVGSRQPVDMLVIVDRSGSMSGEKIAFAQEALRQLVGRLKPDDRLGLVAYDSTAEVLMPLDYATSDARRRWHEIIADLTVRGNTNLSAGLDLGLGMLDAHRRPNRPARVLLLSDGLANEGDSSVEGLTRRARRAVTGEYVLSTMGIGSDFDENLLTRLAGAGTGAFYYLARLAVLPQFFDAELATANQTVAEGASLELRLGPGMQVSSVMGLPFEQRGSVVTVPLGGVYGGHERRLWITLRVPTHRLSHLPVGTVHARFRTDRGLQELSPVALPGVACVGSYGEFRAGIRPEVWERAMLNEALGRSQEQMGEAIVTGSPADVDRALRDATQHRQLAAELGRSSVVERIDALEESAETAKRAQAAPMPARRAEAKRQKAYGYTTRNRGSYVNADPQAGF